MTDEIPKKRGRPPKAVAQEDDMARVIVMHHTNITLSVGKIPFREMVTIPEGEYKEICAGDEAAGRQPRLVRVDGK